MCLNTVSRKLFTEYKKENGHNVGWKIFSKDDYYHIYSQFQSEKRFKIDKWLKEKDYRSDPNQEYITITSPITYPMGFHFYLSKKDAMRSNHFFEEVRKIYFRKPVASGLQGGKEVMAAKEIFIPSIKKGKNNVSK